MSGEWDDLARLAEAATPGPWEATQEGLTHPDGWEIDAPDGPVVSECCGYTGSVGKTADAEFIAAANPATILRLIRELQQQRHRTDEFQTIAAGFANRAVAAEDRLAAVEALLVCDCGELSCVREQIRAALSAAPTDTTKEQA